MEYREHEVEFCVIGGGVSGMCAAISAARHGIKTLLMHERPVLGGNASSEVRMWICGTPGCMETGIVEEFRLENLYRNTNPSYSVWDSVLYEKVRFQENLTLLLNCSCFDAECKNGKILSVTGHQQTTQQIHKVKARFFADCSGDSVLAPLVGAEFRVGREAKSEFNEKLAQDKADRKTMGMSCILQARQTSSPKKYIPPAWAYSYPTEESIPPRLHDLARLQNYWYLELGGEQDTINDTEEIRDELLKVAFGFWDHIKNHGDHGAENWELEWVGFLPGKRESRRYVGDHILCEKDILGAARFHDAIAYGGWPVDDHHPGGWKYFGPPNGTDQVDIPYTIPLRSLYSVNIGNLFFAGRNISTTHVALSSSRVMATCAIVGQAAGTAAYYALANNCENARQCCTEHYTEIQQTLMDDDCYIPGLTREIPQICREAVISASREGAELLRNGIDRAIDGNENSWKCSAGDKVTYKLAKTEKVTELRLVFDSDLSRDHLNMVSNYFLESEVYIPPRTLVKGFHLLCNGEEIFRTGNNYQRLVKVPLHRTADELTLVIDELYPGVEETKVFAFDFK